MEELLLAVGLRAEGVELLDELVAVGPLAAPVFDLTEDRRLALAALPS